MPATAPDVTWWTSLNHGGLLIAPSRIREFFPHEAPELPEHLADQLRRSLIRLDSGRADDRSAFLDTVLELVLDLAAPGVEGGRWLKGSAVPNEWTRRAASGEALRPRRLWLGPNGALLPVFWDESTRLGVGTGRRPVARVLEWLRKAERPLALLTNASQFRLIYAGLDADAFAEWDTTLWFEEGVPGPQVTALRTLLSTGALVPPTEGGKCGLLRAIEESRKGQAELSAALGERVRQAVELLIREHTAALNVIDNLDPKAIYLAATRVIMRLVVGLFAEARDLLPRDNPIYFGSYGVQGLREELDRMGAGAAAERLRHRRGAWSRILALFRLIHDGSAHEKLPVLRYGGGLFEPGDASGEDHVHRALAVFEDPVHGMSDASVYRLLGLLTRTEVKVRQGRSTTRVMAPVDFSDLSSEYIGILYEGLLDFALRQVKGDDPVVFLALGDEPALPLTRLEGMSDRAVGQLVEKFKQKAKPKMAGEEAGEGEEDEDEDEVEEEGESEGEDEADEEDEEPDQPEAEQVETAEDTRQQARERATNWARRAVSAGKLVPRPRSRAAEAQAEYDQKVSAMAQRIVSRVILPGEWYLVRFGGTRKGSGTFYTRPALAVPTVQRTLRPLAYNKGEDENPEWVPRRPEEILGLKVCDPACGSGSFLVASLRFLTEALAESLHGHGRIRAQGDTTLVTLAEGRPGGETLAEETLPCRPEAEDFDLRLRARLRRYVVERCLYGVDLDPLAVELCRLALWVETMDRNLPFSFLDHKIRCGNSLVGCWFDRFQDYPALAWEREGGDRNHSNGVHFEKGAWTKAIKDFRNNRLKPALREYITGAQSLFEPVPGQPAEAVHDQALAVLEEMHALPVHDVQRRMAYYRERIEKNPALGRLREVFDAWCAAWFWPAGCLDLAPLPTSMGDLSDEQRKHVASIAGYWRFFHWELEFPDVFASAESGFDAVIGNPPWETLQPVSKEFFSNLDPLYRAYGKQEGVQVQRELFTSSRETERLWLDYLARFKAQTNYFDHAGSPFGDSYSGGRRFSLGRGSDGLHATWRSRRAGRRSYSDPEHPYQHQGKGKAYTYRLFSEQGWVLLKMRGRLGFVLPSGVYTDDGSSALRQLFLNRAGWEWLFGFENREKVFDIHSQFKFCAVIVQKGGETLAIETAFMRRDLADWAVAEKVVVPYERDQVRQFSPKTLAILEIRGRRDLEILEKIYSNSVLLGDDGPNGWGIKYSQGDYNMTSDSHLFVPRPAAEENGYVGDEYGRWLKGRWHERPARGTAAVGTPRWEIEAGIILSQDGTRFIAEDEVEGVMLPLYEGRMIGQFDFSQKGWVSGRGRSAEWRDIPWADKVLEPQWLMRAEDLALSDKGEPGPKIAYMRISSGTNTRTTIATYLEGVPAGDSVFFFTPSQQPFDVAASVVGVFGTLPYDFQVRTRLGGLNMSEFVMVDTALPRPSPRLGLGAVIEHTVRLGLAHPRFAPRWLEWVKRRASPRRKWKSLWGLCYAERLRLRVQLDAIVTVHYGLSPDDHAWLVRDCDLPTDQIRQRRDAGLLDVKGFWRVDQELAPELRQTVLTQVAITDLAELIATQGGDTAKGIGAFLNLNNGAGWQLPESVRLADYGLGHDQRAKERQPVRSVMGHPFYDFQLDQNVEESWRECELHARNILGEVGLARLQAELTAPLTTQEPVRRVAEEMVQPYSVRQEGRRQHDLFGGEPPEE